MHLLFLLVLLVSASSATAQSSTSFDVVEATIADIHAAFESGELTCRGLVELYLDRIDAYDKNGPAINAVVLINPNATIVADSLDLLYARSGPGGPLHCIPVIVKDNFQTAGLRTTAGSESLAEFVPAEDAFQVARVKEAGGIVLFKSNMAEFAFSPYETVSSILPGYTRNPYALNRVTAGSSGGTAAGVAASFGAVGLGTDTGNSIRGPSAHQALVGFRSTMGLTSRAGVVPLNLAADIAGPMTRTVADAVAVFQVIAGADPDDPVTAGSRGRVHDAYASFLDRDGLRGARIGVLREAYQRPTTDPEVERLFRAALLDMEHAGAIIIDSAPIAGFDELMRNRRGGCSQFKFDINAYLAGLGDQVPVHSLEEIIESRDFHPTIRDRLEGGQEADIPPESNPACEQLEQFREGLRAAVLAAMDRHQLDAFVYPTWSNPPRLIGDLTTPHGDNSQVFSPSTGFPSIQVPMGYLRGGILPAGISFFGRPWREDTLIRLAFAYEQATRHRRPPTTTPPLNPN